MSKTKYIQHVSSHGAARNRRRVRNVDAVISVRYIKSISTRCFLKPWQSIKETLEDGATKTSEALKLACEDDNYQASGIFSDLIAEMICKDSRRE